MLPDFDSANPPPSSVLPQSPAPSNDAGGIDYDSDSDEQPRGSRKVPSYRSSRTASTSCSPRLPSPSPYPDLASDIIISGRGSPAPVNSITAPLSLANAARPLADAARSAATTFGPSACSDSPFGCVASRSSSQLAPHDGSSEGSPSSACSGGSSRSSGSPRYPMRQKNGAVQALCLIARRNSTLSPVPVPAGAQSGPSDSTAGTASDASGFRRRKQRVHLPADPAVVGIQEARRRLGSGSDSD